MSRPELWATFRPDASVACYVPNAGIRELADEAATVRCDCCGESRLMIRTDVAGLLAVRDALAAVGIPSHLDQTGGMCVALDAGALGVVVCEGDVDEFTVCPPWSQDDDGAGPFAELRGVPAVVEALRARVAQ